MLRVILVVAFLATPAVAQITNYTTDGNLEPTYKLKCMSVDELKPQYSPADISLSVLDCYRKRKDDTAIELIYVLKSRAAFDAERVTDKTAHGAGTVLVHNVAAKAGSGWDRRITKALERFGDFGSPRHKALCQKMQASGPPTHSPRYMVQHGMNAVKESLAPGSGSKKPALVSNFNAKAAWREVLRNYVKCGG